MKLLITAIAGSLLLAGCVTTSETDTLIPQTYTAVDPSSALSRAVTVTELGGDYTEVFKGQVSNAALSEALTQALSQSGMLADMNAKYSVVPNLVHLKQPAIGLDMTVTAKVNYIVKDASGRIVMDETLSTPHTVKMSDAFVGATRVRMANEGAVRENISAFIEKLTQFAQN